MAKNTLDFVAGVSACSLGHRHPAVIRAIKKQLKRYLHVMVYEEYAQQPAVELYEAIGKSTSNILEVTYLTNSGTEAIEGAMKLSKGSLVVKNLWPRNTRITEAHKEP